MWTRHDLKAKAKVAFKANYWKCVLVAFLAMLFEGAITTNTSRQTFKDVASGDGVHLDPSAFSPIIALAIGGSALLLVIVVIAIDIFLINPLVVGCDNFFLNNRRDSQTKVGAMSFAFSTNYKNIVKTRFMTDLFITLWTLLLIVPGIIKMYEYRMVSYILAENPDTDYRTAQQISKSLMDGHKFNAFILDLSFILWYLLGALTFGLVNLFYTFPYIQATNAELFIALAYPGESSVIEAGGPAVKGAETVEFTVEKND